jgi:hypothetical protein
MKPIEEALKRWWQWRYGYNKEIPSVKEMWEDMHSWSEPGGGLMYKQALYERLQEVANDQYKIVEKAQSISSIEYEILCAAISGGLDDSEIKTEILLKVQKLRDAVISTEVGK